MFRRPAFPRLAPPDLRLGCGLMLAAAFPFLVASPAGAQLARQTFEVNLGSGAIPGPLPFDEPFYLSAPAPDNLLEVRLWALPERELKREECPRATTDIVGGSRAAQRRGTGPIQTELTASWSRGRLDSLTKFVLEADPLSPNRDYTFCFHLLRKPTAADSIAFSALATRNITAALEARATNLIKEVAFLDSVQAALIRALPAADSIVLLGSESIFRVPTGETVAQKRKRLDRVLNLASEYLRITRNRRRKDASEVEQYRAAGNALYALFQHPALPQLARAYPNSVPAGLDSSRLRVAAVLGARISRFDQTDAAAIAGGAFPLDASPVPETSRDISAAKKSADLSAYVENLTRTLTLLRDLAALAALARERPGATSGLPSRAALDGLIAHLDAALLQITGERQELLSISDLLDQRATEVQKLVTSIRTLDFARIALRSTTSDTYKARANMYIGLDAGILGAQDVRRLVPYFGANLYFRPVNKNAPLGRCFCLGRRASLTLGATAVSVAEKDRIEDTFKGHSILTGVGVRLTDYWRISGGLLIVRTYDEDEPGELRLGAVPSWATSLDIDIVGLLGKVGTALLP